MENVLSKMEVFERMCNNLLIGTSMCGKRYEI